MAQAEKGSIADYALVRVFEHLGESQATGVLEVRSPRGKKFILLKRGEIMLASEGDFRREFLGELLVAREKMSRQDLIKALKLQKSSGQKLGDVLIEMGVINAGDIEDALRFQVEEEICDLFSWKQGIYEFRPDETLPKEADATAIRLNINPKTMLIESAKRLRQWDDISQFIPSPLVVYQLTPTGKRLLKTAAKGGKRLLTMIDQGLPVEEIVRCSYLGRFTIYKAVSNLVKTSSVAERNQEELEHIAADNVRNKHYKIARFIHSRLLELAKTPIEIERAKEQLAYLDEVERTETKVMTAAVSAGVPEVSKTSAITRAIPAEEIHKPAKRRVLLGVAALIIALVAITAIFFVAFTERIFDSGKAELETLLTTAEDSINSGDYEAAYQAYQGFLARYPTGNSRKEVEKQLEDLREKMDQKVKEGLAEAAALAVAENYRGALNRLGTLLETFPSSALRMEVIKEQERLKRERQAYLEKSTAQEASKMLLKARLMFKEGRLEEAADILNDIISTPKAPKDTTTGATLLLSEVRNLERVLDDLFATGLSREAAGDYEAAIVTYRQVINRSPQSARAHKARSHLVDIEGNKERLRLMLERADAFLASSKSLEAINLLERIGKSKGYVEADIARERLAPLKDRLERAQKVLAAYNEAIAQQDFTSAARFARSIFEEHSTFVDTSLVRMPLAIHSVPSGANVTVDGKPAGTTPCTVFITADRRTPIRLTHQGFHPAEIVTADTGKPVHRIYLERRPRRRITIPGKVAAVELSDREQLALVLAPADENSECWLGVLTLDDGSFRKLSSLKVNQLEAVIHYRGKLYFASKGRIASGSLAGDGISVIKSLLPRDADIMELYVERAPLLANKVIASLVFNNGKSVGFTVDDGEQVWNAQVTRKVISTAEGTASLLLYDGERVLCMNRTGGNVRWALNTGPLQAGPEVSSAGWFGLVDRRLMLLAGDLATGDITSQAPLSGIRNLYPPLHLAASKDLLYLTSREFFYVLRPGKGVISETAIDRKILAKPVISEKYIYLIGDGVMYRIPKGSARPDWRYNTKGTIARVLVTTMGIAVVENLKDGGNVLLFDE